MESIRKLDKKLGIGARGVVYQGFDEDNGWFVAIKEIPLIERSFANDGTPHRPSARSPRLLVDASSEEDGQSPCSSGRSGAHDGDSSNPLDAGPQPFALSAVVGASSSHSRGEEEEEAALILREIRVLERATHPHLVRYYGTRRSPVGVQIIMEYIGGGSLESLLRRCGSLRERVVRRYTHDVLQGLVYLHETMKVCHRDVKPGNVLLTTDGRCKLTDFGVSKALGGGTGSSSPSSRQGRSGAAGGDVFMCTTVGTPWYMAPEVISGGVEDEDEDGDDDSADLAHELRRLLPRHSDGLKEGYSTAADVWSLGVTVYEMLSGARPFGHGLHNPTAVLFHIVNTAATETPQLPDDCHVSQAARDFLDLCFVYDRTLRPSARELLGHAWFHGGEAGDAAPSQHATQSEARLDAGAAAASVRAHRASASMAPVEATKFAGALDAFDMASAVMEPPPLPPPSSSSARPMPSPSARAARVHAPARDITSPRTPVGSAAVQTRPSASARATSTVHGTRSSSNGTSSSAMDPAAARYALLREHAAKMAGPPTPRPQAGQRTPTVASSTGLWTRDGYYVDLMSTDPLENL